METSPRPWAANDGPRRCALIGAGRMGSALAAALPTAGIVVLGPFGRDDVARVPADCDAVLLCVPDTSIAAAAAALPPASGRLIGHLSGATGLAPVRDAGHEAFSLHPLMTVTGADATFTGAGCAVDGATDRALDAATALGRALGMAPVRIADEDRIAYHAAASIASNFLVTLEDAAERVLAGAHAPRELLVPLVRATVENWAARGGREALTGPIARGDEATVAAQRAAVAARVPDLLPLFDALADATRALAAPAEVAA